MSASASATKPNDPCWCGSGQKYKRCHKATTDRIRPGTLTPYRTVPDSIVRPPYGGDLPTGMPRSPYVVGGVPPERNASVVQTPDVIERMRAAGRAAAEVLMLAGEAVRPGITTDEIDAIVHAACIDRGGYPSPLNYRGYPKSVCTSVNEIICHGIPDDRTLIDGDVIDIDVTIYLGGVHGDTNATFPVGTVDPESLRLIRVTRECMEAGIAEVRPGRPVNVIGKAIQDHAHAEGFEVVRAFIGHAVAEDFHGDLAIPHYYEPRANRIIEEGMTFTIEPMISMGTWRHEMWDDGWTAVTADRSRVAQFEHTMVVTNDGVEVLTVTADGSWAGQGAPRVTAATPA